MKDNREESFMAEALKQAQKAFEEDEVPVGAVIVHGNRIIAKAYNQVEKLKDPTAHAEMIAITQATSMLGSKWLLEATLYVTIEPCSMCTGAAVLARLKSIVYGADDLKTGACGSVIDIAKHTKLNYHILVQKGVLKEDCASLLKEFFKKKRQKEN